MLPAMYRYGDGTPFPLDENFIETLTAAVETCTNAFVPLTELDARREKAKDVRREADKELGRLADLEATVVGSLVPFSPTDGKKPSLTQQVAQKIAAAAKTSVIEARRQVENRVAATEAQAAPKTSSDAVLEALRPFFDEQPKCAGAGGLHLNSPSARRQRAAPRRGLGYSAR